MYENTRYLNSFTKLALLTYFGEEKPYRAAMCIHTQEIDTIKRDRRATRKGHSDRQ